MAAMYWMAWSWTSTGMVMRTVGLDVGTGRGGMRRPASAAGEADAASLGAEEPLGEAEGVMVQALASRSARGPVLSHAATAHPARRTTSKEVRIGGPILYLSRRLRKPEGSLGLVPDGRTLIRDPACVVSSCPSC